MTSGKDALRAEARARRRALQAAAPEAGALAAAHFPDDLLAALDSAALSWPAKSEIDPRPLGARLAGAGVRLCLPAVAETQAPLVFRQWRESDALAPDVLGITAPPPDAAVLRPDLVVVPLLGFDAEGGRLGQGGGYYDRTIAQLRLGGPVFILGLAYAGQEMARLPGETHDQPLDAVLTEAGFRLFE